MAYSESKSNLARFVMNGPHQTKAEYDWSNFVLRTGFLKKTAADLHTTARGDLGPVTAKAVYWRLHALTGLHQAAVRDLAECAIITDEQRGRLEQVRDLLKWAEDLLRECYDAEPSGDGS